MTQQIRTCSKTNGPLTGDLVRVRHHGRDWTGTFTGDVKPSKLWKKVGRIAVAQDGSYWVPWRVGDGVVIEVIGNRGGGVL